MNQEKRLEILKALQADNPTPKTELEYHSNFELLIAVVLSAQATDKSVNEATRVLFPLANTPQAVLDLGPEKFTDIIKHIGLYRSKTKNVMKLCEDLIEHHNGQVPTDFDSPSSFSVTGVVSGWTTVLQYMHTKERWILYIPYQCGYGESGYGSILGYSTLTFDMQLEAVK